MINTKIFAAYLPQYHEIEENNKFWGKGFTDWVAVRKARPEYEGQIQPRIPLDNNYYDLSKKESIEWQAKLAREYGVSGFNIYHYWFKDGHKVLETPAEIILENKDIDINFFFSWDNSSWIRSWSNVWGNAWAPNFDNGKENESPYLLECNYGNKEDWKMHFDYLLTFFMDNRYFKIDGMPVFIFFTDFDPDRLKEMSEYWNELARENGLPGIFYIVQKAPFFNKHLFDNQFIYHPLAVWNKQRAITRRLKKLFHISATNKKFDMYDYDKAWKKNISQAKRYKNKRMYFSGIVRYDDTPRRGKNANVFVGDTPEKFEKYLSELYKLCCDNDKEFMLLTAWNEWGEGAYLEPDVESGYKYLEAIKHVVETED